MTDNKWDDSIIMDCFERSIRSHRLQAAATSSAGGHAPSAHQNDHKRTGSRSMYDTAVGEPGPWEPVDRYLFDCLLLPTMMSI